MTARDRIVHIHNGSGPCVVCGTADDSSTSFVSDTGHWNTLNRTCQPQARVSPDYVVTGRQDPRTSALKGERKPPRKKVRDRR